MIKWTDLVGIMKWVREGQILYDYTYMWNFKLKRTNNENWLIDKENKLVVTIVDTDVKIGEIGEED